MKKLLFLLALLCLFAQRAWAQSVEESKVKTYGDLTDASGAAISAEKYYLMALPGRGNYALTYYTTSSNKIVCADNQYAANKSYPASYVYQLESANDGANVIIKNLGKSENNYIHVASGDYADGQGKVTVDGTSENAERWQIYKGVETANRFHFNTTGAAETQRTLSNNGGVSAGAKNLGFWNGNGSDRWSDGGGQFSFKQVEPITISVEDSEGGQYPFSVNGTDYAAGTHTIFVENFTNFTLTCNGTPAKYKVNGVEQTEVPTWASGMTVVAVLDRTIFDASKVVALNATKITDVASIDKNKAYILKNTGRGFYMGLNSSNQSVGKKYHKHTNSTSNLMWYILPQGDGTYKLQSVYNQEYVPALTWDTQFTTVAGAENGDNFTIVASGEKFAFVSTATHTNGNKIYLDGNDRNPVGWDATGNPNGYNAYEIYEVETANYDMPAIPVSNGNYYMLKMRGKWVAFNGATGVSGSNLSSPVITPADDMQGYYWKFEGNNEDGWTITNKGTGKAYHTTSDEATVPEGNGKWIIEYNPVAGKNPGWRIVAKDTEKTYANERTGLGTWVNDAAVDNDGCVVVFQESTPIEFTNGKSYYMYSDTRTTRRWIDLNQSGRTNTNLLASQKLTFEANSDNTAYYIKDAEGNYVKQIEDSKIPATTTDQAEAGQFTLRPFANSLSIGKKGDNNSARTGWHLNSSGNLVGWDCDNDNSKWQIADITVPEAGHFYTFKGTANENHMTSLLNGNNKVVVNSTATGKDIIWYVNDDNKLVAYANGKSPWIGGSGASALKETTDGSVTAATYEYYAPNKLLIKLNSRYAYNANSTLDSGTENGGDTYPGYKWVAEEVEDMYLVTTEAEQTVETEDGVQIQNGGYLYVAEGATITASEKDGYTADIVKNDEAKTITVNYTEDAAPVKFVDGYYFIKNASDQYATNDFTTTAFGAKVDAYNGMWKATYDEEDNTITINSGVGTPLYVGVNSYSELTFTGKHNGSFTAKSADDAVWTFEPVVLGARLISNVTIVGDNGEGWLIFNHNLNEERAKDGGFFLIHTSNDFGGAYSNLTYDEIQGKDATIKVNGHNDITLGYASQADIEALEARIREVFPYLNTIGYPKYPNDDPVAEQSIFDLQFVGVGIADIAPGLYAEFVQDLNVIYNAADVVLPTAGGFYDLTDYNGNTKTYYLTENNELISYENGQFTKIGMNEGVACVDYAIAGTTEGETFEFSKSTAGFGKLAAWQIGEGPLPSGDGRINSGWTITKNDKLALTVKSSGYSTFYCPVDVQFEDATVYTAEVNEAKRVITFTELDEGKVPAGTPVLVEMNGGGKADPTIWTGDALPAVEKGDLMGSYVSLPCVQAEGTDHTVFDTTVNDKGVDYHIYTMQNGTWKYYVGTKIPGFKAYFGLHANTPEAVQAYTFQFDDKVVTSIDELFGTTQPKQVFDLSGRQVNNAQRGLYIVNGKKVLR